MVYSRIRLGIIGGREGKKEEKNHRFQKYPDTCGRGLNSGGGGGGTYIKR